MIRPEILAPAGSMEAVMAAVNAGADAIYIGGKQFSARAYATNLDTEELQRAIDYCHIYDKKIYLAVNTLIKQDEFEDLYRHIKPLYTHGLDAVILQDLGAIKLVRDEFKDLPIHGSTQMTIHGIGGTQLFKELGMERVVLSRELSLGEIRAIKDAVDIEIECFIHGALCYCYSGQCLMSSILGGRSGNRGRCAQTCRLPFKVNGRSLQEKYLLSPKDMCTVDILPEIIEAGVDSLKIEGRMKRPEYVAGVVSIYRKYLEAYYMKDKYQVASEDRQQLLALFNRGGFNQGYYKETNGKTMMAMVKPNHWGTKIGSVEKLQGNHAMIRLEDNVSEKDQLEIWGMDEPYSFTMDHSAKAGQVISTKMKSSKGVGSGQVVYRVKNEALLAHLRREYLENENKVKVQGCLTARLGRPLSFRVVYRGYEINVTSDMVEEAKNQPTVEEKLRAQLNKTGNTPFEFDEIRINKDDQIFIPIQRINEIRRAALELLTNQITAYYRREEKDSYTLQRKLISGHTIDKQLIVALSDLKKLDLVLDFNEIQTIYLEYSNELFKEGINWVHKCKKYSKKVYLILPSILRRNDFHRYCPDDFLQLFDGFIVRNYEALYALKEKEFKREIILDSSIYFMNASAISLAKEWGIDGLTTSLELNYKELRGLDLHNMNLMVYGNIPLMTTAQCVHKNINGCNKKEGIITLTDRYNKNFYVKNHCGFCYNTIYNGQPLNLIDQKTKIDNLNVKNLIVKLTIEDEKTSKAILNDYVKVFCHHEDPSISLENFTRGHFLRGVE